MSNSTGYAAYFCNLSNKKCNSSIEIEDNFRHEKINLIPSTQNSDIKMPLILFTDSMELNFQNLQQIDSEFCSNFNKVILLHNLNVSADKNALRSFSNSRKIYFAGFQHQNELPFSKVRNILSRIKQIKDVICSTYVQEKMIGSGASWSAFLFDVIEAGMFCETPILIMGESGTGKELAASLINRVQKQRNISKGMTIVDCTTLQKDLAGSELFGHEKGSFTNAISFREGAVELADSGTLFLDEIGELPMDLQNMLLRILQEGKYKRIGASYYRSTDFRLICATNRILSDEVQKGFFREDLYFRISGTVLKAPPLSERTEDIPALSQFFFRKYFKNEYLSETSETPGIGIFETKAINYLKERDYKGNVRELEQLISRIAFKYTGGRVSFFDVLAADQENTAERNTIDGNETFDSKIREKLNAGASLKEIKDLAVHTAIDEAITSSGGVIKEAAAKLGITERAIHHRRNGKCKIEGEARIAAD